MAQKTVRLSKNDKKQIATTKPVLNRRQLRSNKSRNQVALNALMHCGHWPVMIDTPAVKTGGGGGGGGGLVGHHRH